MTMRILWLVLLAFPGLVLGTAPTEYQCEIKGDPHLTAFSGQSAPLPWPCVYPVTKVKFIHDELNTMYIEVFATSDVQRYEGNYYVSYVQVIVKHGLKEATYTVDAREGTVNASWVTDGSHTPYMTYYMNTTSNPDKPEFVFTIVGFPLLTFRPVNKDEKPFNQSLTPGLFVKVPNKGALEFDDAEFPKTVCSTPDGRLDFHSVTKGGPISRKEQVMIYHGLKYEPHPADSDVCRQLKWMCDECITRQHLTDKDGQERLLQSTALLTMTKGQEQCMKSENERMEILPVFAFFLLVEVCRSPVVNDQVIEATNAILNECHIDVKITNETRGLVE